MSHDWQATEVRIRTWVVDHAPLPLLTHAHETFLAVAMGLVGLGLVLGGARPGSIYSQTPHWMATGWAWALMVGGLMTLAGQFYAHPRTEWAGQMLLGWSCGFYSCALWQAADLRTSAVAVAVFSGFAAVSWWRAFKITSAPYVHHRLNEEAARALGRITKGRR